MSCTLWPDQCTFIFIVHSSEKGGEEGTYPEEWEIEATTEVSRGECSLFLQSLKYCSNTRSWHAPSFVFCGSHSYKAIQLISQRMKRWTQIISFSLFFTARRALFINNNAMIKWHDTQIVVAWRTLSAWINWCNLVLFSECLCEEANLNKYICSQVCASNSSSVEWL